MQISSKKTATLIALFLMFAMAFSLVALPVANAHDPPWTFPTNAYVACTPSTIGLGQYTTIVMWVDRYSPAAGGGQGQRWNGFKLDITKPDGTKQTLGPYQALSDVGSHYVVYTPDQLGTYTVVFSWPGETVVATPELPYTGSGLGDFYEGSTSAPAYLVVQEEPVEGWKETPLPTEYWQRPITALNRDWGQLASNWLKGSWLVNDFQRWGTGPESAHVLWTQPLTPGRIGGLNDAQWPTIPSNKHDYEDPWTQAIIMNGKVYQNTPSVADSSKYGYYCRDLYTGEIIWYKNGTDNGLNNPVTMVTGGFGTASPRSTQSFLSLTQGWLYHYHSVNGQGIVAYLIMTSGSTWYILDAATGNWIMTLINVPGGTSVTDEDGNLLRYSYNRNTGNILCWNISQSIPPGGITGTAQQQWRPRIGGVVDAVNDTTWVGYRSSSVPDYVADTPRSGYTMNVTIEADLPGSITILQDENRVPKYIMGRTVPTHASTSGSSVSENYFSAWLVSIDDHVTGYSPYPDIICTSNNNLGFGATLLWNKNITVPIPNKNYTWSIDGESYDNMIFCLECKQLMQRWGYSLETGALLWGPTPAEGQISFYGIGSDSYYGHILSGGYDGVLYSYDAETGELEWTYNATAPAYESPYGDNYPISIFAVADGKVYLYSSEHSPTKPLWRPYMRCVNITDGTEIWKLLYYHGFASGADESLAEGFIIGGNSYDNNIYCIGKGPSATTVTASPKVSVHGSSVLVEGMVTDTSPGTEQLAQTARYPNGVPAIADEDMGPWMEYLYEQQAKPADATGVEVVLSVLDPNGNSYEVGRTTSDADGMFKLAFEPEVPGEYTVIANFDGSKSYWPSQAKTAINVEEAPAATPPPTPPPASVADMYFVPATIGIIIAIVVVGLILFLMLRKR
jgi:hypothetical protein